MFSEGFIVNSDRGTVQAAKFGGWLDSIIKSIGTGVQVATGGVSLWQQIQGQLGGGSSSGGSQPAKGLQQITQRTNEILQMLDTLLAQIGNQPYEQIYQQARQLVSALSNPQIIYQAQRGEDAAVLQRAKTVANQKLQQIAAAAGGVTGNITDQTGQIITSGGNAITSGFDTLANNPFLYIAGGGFLMYLLLRRK